jgi:hypothetical protein
MAMRTTAIILGTLILAMAAAPAPALQEREREELREQIRNVKAWELVRELGLDQQRTQEFVPLYDEYDRTRGQHRHERKRLEETLEVLVKDSSRNADQIRSVMNDLRRLDEQLKADDDGFRRRAFHLLSLEQQARFELFEKRFNARLRELIKDVREDRGKSPNEKPKQDTEKPEKDTRDRSQERG